MTRQPETSGRVECGEAATLPDAHGTWGAIKRHRKHGEPLCTTCAERQRNYNRAYARVRLGSDVFRTRRNEAKRQRDRRIYTDPAKVASLNARRRQRRQEAINQARAAALIDEVVIARLIDGEPVTYNRAERLEAVRQLRNKGLPYQQIAERLHVTERQVHRDLADLGLVNSTGEVA